MKRIITIENELNKYVKVLLEKYPEINSIDIRVNATKDNYDNINISKINSEENKMECSPANQKGKKIRK